MQDWARLVMQVQDSIIERVLGVETYTITVAQVAIAWSSLLAIIENLLNADPDDVNTYAVSVVTACGKWFWRAMQEPE